MVKNNIETQIPLLKTTRDRLKQSVNRNETYDDIINKNIDFVKKFGNEREFSSWFKENYGLFGFESIIVENKTGTPDFIMNRDGKIVKVELESYSSNFILHGHNPKDVDLVICLVKNRELPVETVEINNFEYVPPQKIYSKKLAIWVSPTTRKRLDSVKIISRETYEDIIIRFLKLNNKLSKEYVKSMNEEHKVEAIWMTSDTKKKLESLKLYPREIFDDIINRLLDGKGN